MRKIEAKIICDSIDPRGNRITTMLLTFPRFILAELNTHRMFSKNSASSRAIPFEKMVKMVEEDPFIPIAWQKQHKGMQGNEYVIDEIEIENNKNLWIIARNNAIADAKRLNSVSGITKQLCNRLLEPFMWHTVLVTATEFSNFFNLRCSKYWETSLKEEYFNSKKDLLKKYPQREIEDVYYWFNHNKSQAEIHMQALAESMWDAMNESIPNELKAGEWHTPFGDKINLPSPISIPEGLTLDEGVQLRKLMISTARCARLSYMNFDGEIDYDKDIELHNKLLESGHFSPFENCARVMTDDEYFSYIKGTRWMNGMVSMIEKDSLGWCNNFRGFIQYRYMLQNKLSI